MSYINVSSEFKNKIKILCNEYDHIYEAYDEYLIVRIEIVKDFDLIRDKLRFILRDFE